MATYSKKKGKEKAYHLAFCSENSNLSFLHSQLLCGLTPPMDLHLSLQRALPVYWSSPATCNLGEGDTSMFKSIYGTHSKRKGNDALTSEAAL